MTTLFDPLPLRSLVLRNRIGVSPMCMYSATDGLVNDWHLVHLGRFAIGGAGLVIAEATAVQTVGRITPSCTGIWSDEHIAPWARVTEFISRHGAVPTLQLAHAGRKAATPEPWATGPRGTLPPDRRGWQPVGPSAVPFDAPNFATPTELTVSQIAELAEDFIAAAGRAAQAGFGMIELHAAHGYLLHSFHSPISNRRTDQYGGALENRVRLLRSVVQRLRTPGSPWPQDRPIAVRISAVDDVEGGWSLEDSVQLARWLKADGVDLVDCSSGGISMQNGTVRTPREPGYQVPYAARVRAEAGIATAAVGGITQPAQAQAIIAEGKADVTLLAREMLRDPFWPVHAAAVLNVPGAVRLPNQYDYWIGPPKSA